MKTCILLLLQRDASSSLTLDKLEVAASMASYLSANGLSLDKALNVLRNQQFLHAGSHLDCAVHTSDEVTWVVVRAKVSPAGLNKKEMTDAETRLSSIYDHAIVGLDTLHLFDKEPFSVRRCMRNKLERFLDFCMG